MKSIQFFGYSIGLSKKKAANAPNSQSEKKRATGTIRKQPKREVSFQIKDIKSALTMAGAEDPDRSRLHEIYSYILRDGHLKSQIRLAKAKLMAEPWMMFRDDKPDEELSKQLRKRWFRHIIEYILESEFHGYSAVELTWTDTPTGMLAQVENIERQYVSIERQALLIEGTISGPSLPYAEIAWDLDLLEFGKRNDYGILLECAYNVLWKYYSRSDWSRASEKFGMPILSIEAETNNPDELDDLENRAANFGSDGYIVTQKGDTVNVIERAGQKMHDIYLDNIKLCNDEVSKIVNGQIGTSDQMARVGSAEVQERVMDDFTYDRMQNIVDEVTEKLLPYLVHKGIVPEGYSFDYPALIRERERRLNGQSSTTDPKEKAGEKQADKAEKKDK